MSLRHAILTALLERPSSGLDLTRRFDRSIGYFWSATHQQVYRELARLEDDALVAATPGTPGRGSPKLYDVLPAGRAELTAWLAGSDDPRALRDPLMLRLRAGAAIGPGGVEVLRPELRRHLELHRARLAAYRAIEARDFTAPDRPGPTEAQRLQHLVLRAGLGLEEHWIAWLETALDELRRA